MSTQNLTALLADAFGAGDGAIWPHAPAQYVDFRGEAIRVCHQWRLARDAHVRQAAPRFGLYRRSKLLNVAMAIEPSLEPLQGDHPDAHAARLACLDWIVLTLRQQAPALREKSIQGLDRFFWGYLENTSTFEQFFEARRAGRRMTNPLLASPPKTAQCYVGCAWGAPTLGALVAAAGGMRSRGRWPMLFVNDEAYAVLAANPSGRRLIQLERAPRCGSDPLSESHEIALRTMTDSKKADFWPAFLIQRSGASKLVLHLAFGRRGAGHRSLGENPERWLTLQDSPTSLIEEIHRRDFQSSNGTDWGSFEQLLWHVTRPDGASRRQRDFFANLPHRSPGQ